MQKTSSASILSQTKDLVYETGQLLKEKQRNLHKLNIRLKGKNDLVSEADIEAEAKLVEGLKTILPGSRFITEEKYPEEILNSDDPTWIIDPLDGTTNFLHSYLPYAVSVGLAEKGKLTMGIIYEVERDEMFYASEAEEGAFKNGSPIEVSKNTNLQESLFATGFPSREAEYIEPYTELMKELMTGSHGLRRMGSAALDLAYVACGRFDGFFEYGLYPWDIAAGSFLVEKAGGKVTNFRGGNDFLFNKEIVAANKHVFNALLERIQKHF